MSRGTVLNNDSGQGPVSQKPQKHFGPVKPFFLSKNREVYTPEISCMKGTSVHIKNMSKQLHNHKV